MITSSPEHIYVSYSILLIDSDFTNVLINYAIISPSLRSLSRLQILKL